MVKILRSEDKGIRLAQYEFAFLNYQHRVKTARCCLFFLFLVITEGVLAQQHYVLKLPNAEAIRSRDSIASYAFMNRALKNYYAQGYALAIWQLDSITQNHPDSLVGYYSLIPEKMIRCDSLILGQDSKIRPKILAAMLAWQKGHLFVYQSFQQNRMALNQLGWIQIESPSLFFQEQKVNMRVKPQFKKANELNALLGVQPNNNGKSTLIGDFHFLFLNAFRHAEKMEVQWQRQALNTQRLQLEFNLPYCFGSPFGLGAQANIYRRAELFLQTQAKMAFQYHSQPLQSSELFVHQQSTVSLGNAENTKITQRTVGVQFHYQWKRHSCILSAYSSYSRGNRIIQSTATAEKTSISITEHSLSIRPFWRRFFLSSELHYWFQSSTATQSSEWKRIGGSETLRGFQQESLFARTGAILQNSIGVGNDEQQPFFVFCDYSQMNMTTQPIFRPYWSWGLGAMVQTPNGGIKINYGWGKFPDQKIEYRNGIVNLSYQVYF